jgi:O-antigen/teichoic acid export membrane protein
VPTAIVASFFPSIIEAKKQSESLYYQRLQQLYNLMVALSVLAAIPVTFASDWLVTILFGNQYEGAGSILAIHVWAGVFVSLGVASGKWFTIENISKQIFYRSFIGALTNIALNSVLIPKFGIQGCALATLISYSIAAFWFDLLLKNTRKTFFMKIKAFFLGFL